MIILLIWVVVLVFVIWLYLRKIYSEYSRHGIKSVPTVPLLGNMGRVMLRSKHYAEDLQDLYNKFPEERFVSRYEFIQGLIMIRDVELLKRITVKDFEYFTDHRTVFESTSDTIFYRNLFLLKGEEWKDMRSTLSPAFTSSKIRLMVPFMVEVADQLMRYLKAKFQGSKEDFIDVDCKDLTTRYTNDVIASCAFGIKVDSHFEENNEFYRNGVKATTFTLRQLLLVIGLVTFPKTMKLLKLSLVPESVKSFFKNLVLETMKDREQRHIIRHDMIHLLMQVKKGNQSHDDKSEPNDDAGFATVEESSIGKRLTSREWSEDDLVAQAFLFFVAGFETVSIAISFLLYELARHPEVQDRLAQEIKQHDIENIGNFDFDLVQKLTYLDMVVSETLRLWPPAIGIDRICLKDYNIGKPSQNVDEDYIVRKGTPILIPAIAIHRDAQFYPDPEKFDPERFSNENKHKINPFAYLPFGLGPRNCIGSRFALCEVKVLVYQILKHVVVSPCEKTCIPPQLAKDSVNLKLKGGHWLRFRLRE